MQRVLSKTALTTAAVTTARSSNSHFRLRNVAQGRPRSLMQIVRVYRRRFHTTTTAQVVLISLGGRSWPASRPASNINEGDTRSQLIAQLSVCALYRSLFISRPQIRESGIRISAAAFCVQSASKKRNAALHFQNTICKAVPYACSGQAPAQARRYIRIA